jgi:hypothetical protein
MPHIRESDKPQIDIRVETLARYIDTKGKLNYAISKLLEAYVLQKGVNYDTLDEARAQAHGAGTEFERLVLGPYEDWKIAENGNAYGEELLHRVHGDGCHR